MDVWEKTLGELLTTEQAAAVLGSEAELDRAERAGELLVLTEQSGRRRFPAFQFTNGEPLPELARAHRVLAGVCDAWTAASWVVAPNPQLDGRSPLVAVLDGDAEVVHVVARRDAAPLAH